ncbi:MAG: O-antigen ligase family protein [Bacilli bacterium]|nr:O-antigen ligase family protein [Bacilli bacterium]
MLSGQYDILVDNMWLTEIIAIILLIIPFFLLFMDGKWIFFFYTISIVANLPLIFSYVFSFSYEAIIGFVIIIVILKDIIKEKVLRYQTTKENLLLLLMLVIIMGINLGTAIFNFNANEFLLRLFIYIVNIFILVVYTYFFKNSLNIKFIKNAFLIGAVILIVSMIVELVYGHYILGYRNLRPAGLLLDPNVCAFALNLAFVISFLDRKTNNFIIDFLAVFVRVLILFGIFLTVSRSAYIGTIFIIIALCVYYSSGKKRWVVPSVVIIFIISYLIFYNVINEFIENIYKIIDLDRIFPKPNDLDIPPSNNGGGQIIEGVDYSNSRIALIKAAFLVFSNNFITGVGVGNLTHEIGIITDLQMNAHNLILQLIAESGIIMLIGLIMLGYGLVVYVVKIEKKHKFIICLLFGLIVIESLFNHNLLNINIIYLTLAIIFGLTMISSKERKVFIYVRDSFKFKVRKYK